jgi:hypothetical protein
MCLPFFNRKRSPSPAAVASVSEASSSSSAFIHMCAARMLVRGESLCTRLAQIAEGKHFVHRAAEGQAHGTLEASQHALEQMRLVLLQLRNFAACRMGMQTAPGDYDDSHAIALNISASVMIRSTEAILAHYESELHKLVCSQLLEVRLEDAIAILSNIYTPGECLSYSLQLD